MCEELAKQILEVENGLGYARGLFMSSSFQPQCGNMEGLHVHVFD